MKTHTTRRGGTSMIVPMMKYSFLVYHADYATFLSEIKKMGVLHIQTKQNEQSAEIQDKYRSLTDLFKTIRSLEERKKADDDGNALMDESISGEEVLEKLRAIEKKLNTKIINLVLWRKKYNNCIHGEIFLQN